MADTAAIIFDSDGSARCLYHELIDLHCLGRLRCTRASRVEFRSETQQWEVRLPGGADPVYSSPSRQECLRWEQENLVPEG